MDYQHKIMENYPRKTVYKFESPIPYIPNIDDTYWFPEDWKQGEQFRVTSVHHYPVDKLIIINVNEACGGTFRTPPFPGDRAWRKDEACGGTFHEISQQADEADWYKCTVCGAEGTVGRCCGKETRIAIRKKKKSL